MEYLQLRWHDMQKVYSSATTSIMVELTRKIQQQKKPTRVTGTLLVNMFSSVVLALELPMQIVDIIRK
jgi:hypothetical protein